MYLDAKKKNLIIDFGVLIGLLIVLFIIRRNLLDVLTPFILSLVFAYILYPAVNHLEKKGFNRILAILIIFIIILGIIIAVFATVIPSIYQELRGFFIDLPRIFEGVIKFFDDFREINIPIYNTDLWSLLNLDKKIVDLSNKLISSGDELLSTIVTSTSKLLDIVMVPIISFYFLKDADKFMPSLSRLVPEKYKAKLKLYIRDIDLVLSGFIRGQLLVALFVGILTGVGCKVIGLPYAITIGIVAGFTNIIPYFGPWLGGVLPVALALITEPILSLWVVIWIVIVQQIESSFISPQIMSQSVGLHPLLVMFSVLLFGNLFGIVGMIIGVPLMGILKVSAYYFIVYREGRNTD